MKISCTRKIEFCAGHRVLWHEGKCKNPHGHNYTAIITAEAEQLDNIGRVVDFSVIKQRIGSWIETNWDHGFIYFSKDENLSLLFKNSDWKSYELNCNPTAENMASYLLNEVCPKELLNLGVKVTEVTIWETANCYATAKL